MFVNLHLEHPQKMHEGFKRVFAVAVAFASRASLTSGVAPAILAKVETSNSHFA
jgi:hypothetical protein